MARKIALPIITSEDISSYPDQASFKINDSFEKIQALLSGLEDRISALE